ncbi:hypothetical protein EGW08_016659, partial [Elysia chlorotica]
MDGSSTYQRSGLTLAALLLLTILCACQAQTITEIEFTTEEEQGEGHFIGNTADRSGLSVEFGDNFQLLLFSAITQGNDFVQYLSINPSSGVIVTKKNIDREAVCPKSDECSKKITIGVHRRSPGSASTELLRLLQVTIKILDINDEAPTFQNPVVQLTVSENVQPFKELYTSLAVDRDAKGPNSVVNYKLVPPTDDFSVTIRTMADGFAEMVITVRKMLNREVQASYQLQVVATDNGEPMQTGSVLIQVMVTDVNDNAPEFGRDNYTASVLENSDNGYPVVIVSATDSDDGENARLTYRLSSQAPAKVKDAFTVDGDTGEVFSRRKLDYETDHSYTFYVTATDHGSPPASASALVTVNVMDVNDNRPDIQVGYGSVLEEQAAGAMVMKVQATDPDDGENARVTYSLAGGDGQSQSGTLFTIDAASGVILTGGARLDREAKEVYTLRVVATDNGPVGLRMSATATATIRILDENDNSPRFSQQGFSTSITENRPARSPAGQVSASDGDVDQNARFEFSILAAPSGEGGGRDDGSFFTINSQTGLILSKQPFDREEKDQYKFSIKVADPAVQNYFDIANVTVTIDDDNDHAPRVLKP